MIFSDNYTVHEIHSIFSKTKLFEYSEMPWLYTPLVDSIYKPTTIPTTVKNNLNGSLGYQYFIKFTDTIKEELKFLGIYHNDDLIQGYSSKFKLRYALIKNERNKFINDTGINPDIFDRVEQVVQATPQGTTAIVGCDHDANGTPTSLILADTEFDVSMYDNGMLSRLNNFSRRNNIFCRGLVKVAADNKITFYSGFIYPKNIGITTAEQGYADILSGDKRLSISYKQGMERHLWGYYQYEFLNDEQWAYIYDVMKSERNDAMVQISHVFKGSVLQDILLHRVKYHEFEEVEVEKPWKSVQEKGLFYPLDIQKSGT